MKVLAPYLYRMRFIIIFVSIGLLFFSWYASNYYDNGIVSYQPFRDKNAVKKMFHDDWQYLYYGDWDKITENDFNVDFMLDNKSSTQHAVTSNLIMKVLRKSGKTVGFLAYYPKSLYWWQMLFVVVDKDYRGKGCASQLVQYCIDDVRNRNAIKLTTFTRLINTPARRVYEGKFGFKDIAHHDEKYMDLLLYVGKK